MAKISLEAMQAFVACVDCGGFSNAAKKLHKSQATISILVSNLEDDLLLKLFDRSGRSPTLTSHGKVAYAYARNVILAQQELMHATGRLLQTQESSVTLILSDYIPIAQREQLKEQFISRINDIKLTLLSAEGHDSVAMLLDGRADLAVIPAMESRMNYPIELSGLKTWFSAPLQLYCAKVHRLSQKERITDYDIKSERRIRLITGTISNHSPRHNILTDNVFRAYSLCALGLGWCELPEWIVELQHQLGDHRLVKMAVPPSKKELEFHVLYRNEPKGNFVNWFINAVTSSP
ncbi:LysR family transcriptional regulator [Citrobacter freundii]|uniref:LysR family transcriptional regulator n=1 Tax=Citrobacter portucalensis TaxID=1639133 RepID=A0A9X4GNF5_9ENTR|nr:MULTISPECIES: LysR family transcriptional regulator [Citrobacter freundii complex]MDE9620906.1 LysR family transcriptional regulator [Citrobacter portucalensis]QLR76412.1 LysR family transcriptional regulator [Citrobacter freundii]